MRRTIQIFLLVIILAAIGLKEGPTLSGPKEEKFFFTAAGIIPHHLLASELIAGFFGRLSDQNPKTIILLGPNHQEKGGLKPLTCLVDWETDSGVVRADRSLIEKFVSLDLVEVNEDVLSAEHSMADLIPLIKDFLPETSIFPIILSGRMGLDEIKILAEQLAGEIGKETVLIAAVDFSHGLKSADARQNDLKTWEVMQSFDYSKLLSLGNDFLDSPPSIALLLLVVKNRGWANAEIINHTNSGELMKNPFAETTSYFLIRYY